MYNCNTDCIMRLGMLKAIPAHLSFNLGGRERACLSSALGPAAKLLLFF